MNQTLATTIKRAWNDNRLVSALIELTYACNLDCSFCYNDLSMPGERLSLAQYKKLFDDMAEMGVLHLALSGGEPLAHPDFFEIGAYARASGFVVRIKSNGHAMKPAIARKVREQIDPFIVEVSIHGAKAATHDRQTRVDGSFTRLLRNIEAMREAGLRVKANSTLTRWNEDELDDLFALCDDLDVLLQIDPEVSPRDDGDLGPLSLTASPAAIQNHLTILKTRAANLKTKAETPTRSPAEERRTAFEGTDKHCGAGSSNIAVDPYGNVLPCVQWRSPVGNLHDLSLKEIWSHAAGLDEAREITTEARTMIDALREPGQLMNFCPGAAHAHHGDPLALYPAAKHRMNDAARDRVHLRVV